MYECINCEWKGEKAGETIHGKKCPNCGDEIKTVTKPEEETKVETDDNSKEEVIEETPKEEKKDAGIFDLNKDGKVDRKDLSLAAQTLRKVGARLRGKKK